MSFEVDHVFVTVPKGAPEMDQLVAEGFDEGPPNRHPGQGTACRRIFFESCYLELAWLESAAEASAPLVERTGLKARARMARGASRLGIGLRAAAPVLRSLPIETWSYRPSYLPAGASFAIAANSRALHEPLIFLMSGERAWSEPERPHPNGTRRVTEIWLDLPEESPRSPELQWLCDSGCVKASSGAKERITVVLDRQAQHQTTTLSPVAPLCLEW